jgi:hypothetical protein
MKFFGFVLMFLSLSCFSQDYNFSDVKTDLNQDGSITYSTSFSFKGDTLKLKSVIQDIKAYAELTGAISEVKEINSKKNLREYYMLYDMPWPLENRQSVSSSRIWNENGKMMIHTKPYKSSYNFENEAIIMDNFFEKWEASQSTNNNISVNVNGLIDLKGELPSWLVKSFIPNELKNSYTSIIEKAIK